MFQPLLPLGGVVGWRLLERTEDAQRAAFEASPQVDRDIAHFLENIASLDTAEALVADRTSFRVALGAFGLDEEVSKSYFIQKVLEEGSEDREALANRFVDPRYQDIARTFGFGDLLGAQTAFPGFGEDIVDRYKTRQFEIAVGNQDQNLRLALGFRREISDYATSDVPDKTNWLRILGSRPMRTVIDAAFNLPSEFATLDIDRQVDILDQRTRDLVGEEGLAGFSDPQNVQKIIDRFLLRKQVEEGPTGMTPGVTALSLLQAGGNGFGATARIGLILSSR